MKSIWQVNIIFCEFSCAALLQVTSYSRIPGTIAQRSLAKPRSVFVDSSHALTAFRSSRALDSNTIVGDRHTVIVGRYATWLSFCFDWLIAAPKFRGLPLDALWIMGLNFFIQYILTSMKMNLRSDWDQPTIGSSAMWTFVFVTTTQEFQCFKHKHFKEDNLASLLQNPSKWVPLIARQRNTSKITQIV